jgi:hypothetical protein
MRVLPLPAEAVPAGILVLDGLEDFAAFFCFSASIRCCSFINSRNETLSADP